MSDTTIIIAESNSIIVQSLTEDRIIAVAEQGPPGPAGSGSTHVDLDQGVFDSFNLIIAQLGIQDLHRFAYTQYGAAKYIIYATKGTERQVCELLLLHDGTSVTIVEYANMVTSTLLGTFSAIISGGFVSLQVDPTEVGTNFKVIRTLLTE